MNNFEFLASMAASKMYTKPSQEWRQIRNYYMQSILLFVWLFT